MLGLGITKGSVVGIEDAIAVPAAPVVTTTDGDSLTTVGSISITLEGTYTGDSVTSGGFLFGSDPNNLTPITDGVTVSGGAITKTGVETEGATIYYYKAFATNAGGTSYGGLEQVTTDRAPIALESFHSSYGNPYYDIEFNATNGIYDFDAWSSFALTLERVSSITDEDGATRSNVLKVEASDSAADGGSGYFYFQDETNFPLEAVFQAGPLQFYYHSYAVEFWCFIPSTNSHVNTFDKFGYGTSGATAFTSTSMSASEISPYGSSDVGSWKKVLYGSETEVGTDFGLKVDEGGQSTDTNLGFVFTSIDTVSPGDVIYIADVKVYRRDGDNLD